MVEVIDILKKEPVLNNTSIVTPKNDLGINEVLGNVKDILKSITEIQKMRNENRSLQNVQEVPLKEPLKTMSLNENSTEINNRIPSATLKINRPNLEEYIDNLLENPSIKEETTIKEIKENWETFKELIIPNIETAIKKIVKSEIIWN